MNRADFMRLIALTPLVNLLQLKTTTQPATSAETVMTGYRNEYGNSYIYTRTGVCAGDIVSIKEGLIIGIALEDAPPNTPVLVCLR